MAKDRFTKKEILKDPADIIAQIQHAKESDNGNDTKHRVSLNIPQDKYDIIKKKSKNKGLTLTAYIMILINDDIENA
jgi:predicted DNA binding CopG/RHH family protein